MSFIESPRFPDDISRGMIIAPEFNTDVVVRFSGHENRFSNWEEARLSSDLSYAAKTVAQGKALYKFFRIVKGKAYGFRIKDWLDYECVQADGVLRPVSGTNARTWRMYKQYINSPNFDERRIAKPVNNGSFQLYLNGSASGAAITVDYVNGELTITNTTDLGLTSDVMTPGTTTYVHWTVPHNLSVGDWVRLDGSPFSGAWAQVLTVPNSQAVTLAYNSTGFGAWAGTTHAYALTNWNPQWSGEFDVPVRFDSDKLQVELGEETIDISQINVVELRHYE